MFGKYFLRVKHMFVDDKIVLMVFAAAGGGEGDSYMQSSFLSTSKTCMFLLHNREKYVSYCIAVVIIQ